jgi:hypothetical protein
MRFVKPEGEQSRAFEQKFVFMFRDTYAIQKSFRRETHQQILQFLAALSGDVRQLRSDGSG